MAFSVRLFSGVCSVLFVLTMVSACKTKGEGDQKGVSALQKCGVCFQGQRCEKGACHGVGSLSVQKLHEILPKKQFLLLNVLDFNAGTIPGTDAQIPFNQIDALVKRIGPDKRKPVVLYCRTIKKARKAAKRLFDLGYTNMALVSGGISAWKKAGYDHK